MTKEQVLEEMELAGVTFADCARFFGLRDAEGEAGTIAAARELYERDGELEFDDHPIVSRGEDNGAYVMAWVWVGDADVSGDEGDEDEGKHCSGAGGDDERPS